MFTLRKNYEAGNKAENVTAGNAPSSAVLLQPKEVEINGFKFIISKMPCTVAQEVLCQLPSGLIPIISQFSKSEEQLFKMLSYCERVYTDGRANVPLVSKTIIDNHVPNFDTLYKLEWEALQYNFDFFEQGKLLTSLQKVLSLAESRTSEILTDLSDKLLQAGVQLSKN